MTQVAAVALGALVLLFRIPGLPSWDTIYGEDYWEFFRQALQQPWHVFLVYNGYEQLVPRVLAQFAAYFPLPQVTRFLTVSGAVVAAACGLFVFHASAGHVRSACRYCSGRRVVAGRADGDRRQRGRHALVPAGAMFWRCCGGRERRPGWRWPRSWPSPQPQLQRERPVRAHGGGAAYALRRPREHAATAGWAAGCLVQIPEILPSYWSGKSRLANRPGPFGHSLAFYAHDVVLPSLGWHLALALEWLAGRDGATVIVAIPLAVVVGAMLATQPANRLFVVNALGWPAFLLLDVRHDADPAPGDPDGIGRQRARFPLHDAADLPDRVHRGGRGRLRSAAADGRRRHRRGAARRPPGWSTRWSSSSRRAGWPTSGTPASAATRPGTGGRSRPSGSTRASARGRA